VTAFTGVAIGVSRPRPFVDPDGRTQRFPELPQAVADVERVTSWLAQLAAAAGHTLTFTRLVAADATRERILDTLRAELAAVPPGGTFVLVLEGHGTEVRDLDGDEAPATRDQAFPTASGYVLDDEIAAIWATRPDVTVFAFSDTCHAESNVVKLDLDRSREPREKYLATETGPVVVQFAGSTRDGVGGDLDLGGDVLSGRFTQALLAVTDQAALASYRTWFAAVTKHVYGQTPILYTRGPDPDAPARAPAFAAPG
jgi:hypothetical protein